jgi:hypothetical protein
LSTRLIWRNASAGSGIVHSVKVETTQSKLWSGAAISSPVAATYSTGNGAAAMRFRASFALVRDGSTPTTRSTPGGYQGRLRPDPKPTSSTVPRTGASVFLRSSVAYLFAIIRFIRRGRMTFS